MVGAEELFAEPADLRFQPGLAAVGQLARRCLMPLLAGYYPHNDGILQIVDPVSDIVGQLHDRTVERLEAGLEVLGRVGTLMAHLAKQCLVMLGQPFKYPVKRAAVVVVYPLGRVPVLGPEVAEVTDFCRLLGCPGIADQRRVLEQPEQGAA